MDIMGTFFHSVTQGIRSVEALKLHNPCEFGLLIGRLCSPDRRTLRDQLKQMGQRYASLELIDRFARQFLFRGRIDPEVFFIDGHFLPYDGLSVIAKGYYTVRRMAMKGNALYLMTDLQGRPLFFITESNEIDFRPIITRAARKLVTYGIERPIMVFDRGGYGIHFFSELSNVADFVTWSKYVSKQTLGSLPEPSFTDEVCVPDGRFLVGETTHEAQESAQTAKKGGRETPTSMELRLVVLKDEDTNDRTWIFTNNLSKPAKVIAY